MAASHGGGWDDERDVDGAQRRSIDGDGPAADDGVAGDDEVAGDGFAEDLFLAPQARSRRMHGDIPICGYNRGEPVPDLALLPRERWREVLSGLSPYGRQLAKNTVATTDDAIAAGILVGDLAAESPPPRLSAPPPMPRAVAEPPARGPRLQVNFRLTPDEHGRQLEAAKAFGMRPAALARLLTVRGVNRALYDDARRDP